MCHEYEKKKIKKKVDNTTIQTQVTSTLIFFLSECINFSDFLIFENLKQTVNIILKLCIIKSFCTPIRIKIV